MFRIFDLIQGRIERRDHNNSEKLHCHYHKNMQRIMLNISTSHIM